MFAIENTTKFLHGTISGVITIFNHDPATDNVSVVSQTTITPPDGTAFDVDSGRKLPIHNQFVFCGIYSKNLLRFEYNSLDKTFIELPLPIRWVGASFDTAMVISQDRLHLYKVDLGTNTYVKEITGVFGSGSVGSDVEHYGIDKQTNLYLIRLSSNYCLSFDSVSDKFLKKLYVPTTFAGRVSYIKGTSWFLIGGDKGGILLEFSTGHYVERNVNYYALSLSSFEFESKFYVGLGTNF